ncbi:MAG: hypothetical protein U5M50_05040 [Sphingobium sp.]|nr:hypothetical protein [Sphingobium sp.]
MQVQSENRVPIPITETGYRSHFCRKAEVEELGGPVGFIRAWLEEACHSKQWQAYQKDYLKTQGLQGLF